MSDSLVLQVIKDFTALAKSKHGDEGALSKVRASITKLQEDDSDFKDPAFEEAANGLAATLVARVSVAGGEEAKDPPSLASQMAHTGVTPYRKVKEPDPVTGSRPTDAAGDADPEHDHTPKHPQPTSKGAVGNAGTGAQPGDTTMKGSGLG
jgi:hypothetical protein